MAARQGANFCYYASYSHAVRVAENGWQIDISNLALETHVQPGIGLNTSLIFESRCDHHAKPCYACLCVTLPCFLHLMLCNLPADIPLKKAVAGVRVGLLPDAGFVVNPTVQQMETSKLDLVMAGTDSAVLMIEGYCDFLTEEQMLEV